MANQTNSLAHTKWVCKYHIVFTLKYRRKIVFNQYKESLRDIIRTLCQYKGVEIIEGKIMPDHVHLLVSIPPKLSVSSFMGYLKGKSALMMFDKHANLKYKFGNRHFWAEGYYVSTVGLNEATIKKYIEHIQESIYMIARIVPKSKRIAQDCHIKGWVYPKICVNSNEAVQNANQIRESGQRSHPMSA